MNTHGVSQLLDTVKRFQYLEAIDTDHGYIPDIHLGNTLTITALAKLKIISNDMSINLRSIIRLLLFLVMPMILYSCDSQKLTAEIEKTDTGHGNYNLQTYSLHLK